MTAQYDAQTIDELSTFFLTRDAWQNWTPTVTQVVAVAINIIFARYVAIGNTVHARAQLSVTGTGTGGNHIVVGGLPFAFAVVTGITGVFEVFDSSAAFYNGVAVVAGATAIVGRAHAQTSNIGITPNFALANGDNVNLAITYEK